MTPAINLAKQHRIAHRVHQYQHDPACPSYGLEAATKLGVDPCRVFKTLVIALDTRTLAVAVIPVSRQLNLKLAATALRAKKAQMAAKTEVQRATGYLLGGVSPLGQKRRLATLIDESAGEFDTIMVSAGRRGLEIELSVADLQHLTGARLVSLCTG